MARRLGAGSEDLGFRGETMPQTVPGLCRAFSIEDPPEALVASPMRRAEGCWEKVPPLLQDAGSGDAGLPWLHRQVACRGAAEHQGLPGALRALPASTLWTVFVSLSL